MRKSSLDHPARLRVSRFAIALALLIGVAAAGEQTPPLDPLHINDEMKSWIDARVFALHSDSYRAHSLMTALNSLNLQYQLGRTGTAADVFSSRKFNCVSFSFLFVGLSRHIGLKTHFLRAIDDPGYTQEGELVVVNEHMTAGVSDGARSRILEFQFLPDPSTHRFRRLTDQQAIALYYSNLGAEKLFEDKPAAAATLFEIAIEKQGDLSEIWVNLGVARRRAGQHEAAEAAYLKALELDPSDSRAYLNLASLMWRLGQENATDRLLHLLEQGDPEDPYAYLVLGDHALRGRRIQDAERFYRRAVRKDRRSGEARAAWGMALLEQGETRKAGKQLRKAQKRDPEHARTVRLARTLELTGDSDPDSSEPRE